MKLDDLRRRLKAGDAILEPGRHASGAPFVPVSDGEFTTPGGALVLGIDLAAPGSPDRSVYTMMIRDKAGVVKLVASGPVHRLHEYNGDHKATIHVLKDELIHRLRTGDYEPHALGPSVGERFQKEALDSGVHGLTWEDSGPSAKELTRIFLTDDAPPGRVSKLGVFPGPDGKITGAPIRDIHDDYMVFADTAFRQPSLFRYIGAGRDGSGMVVYAKGDDSDAIHVASAFCFYPAETVPCRPCGETGKVTESPDGKTWPPSARVGSGCPFCHGLTRIWRCAPWKHPESRPGTVATFAEANPKRYLDTR